MANDSYQSLQVLHFADFIKKQHTKNRLHCVIFGNFGAYNLGDEAILSGQLAELTKIPGLKTTVIARYPNEVKRLHGVKAVSYYSFHAIRKELKKADFLIIGGGGLFNMAEPGVFGFGYKTYLLSLFLWAQRVHKKKIYVIGLGIYSNTNYFLKKLAISLMQNAKLVTVRDQHSVEFLKVNNTRSQLFKDNSYLMDLLPVTRTLQDPYFKRLYKRDRINIGLSIVRPYSKKLEKHLLTELIAFIAKNHVKADFWFYASDYSPKHFNDDKFGHQLHELVKQKVGKEVQFHFVPTNWSPEMFYSSIKLMDFMVSMRLHATIFSYRNGINFVGIVQDKKNASFNASIGREVLQTSDVTWRKLQARLQV